MIGSLNWVLAEFKNEPVARTIMPARRISTAFLRLSFTDYIFRSTISIVKNSLTEYSYSLREILLKRKMALAGPFFVSGLDYIT